MTFNVALAIIAVIFGSLAFKTKNKFIKILAAIVWFFFLPNTIYLVTDVVNIPRDIGETSGIYLLITIFLYLILIPVGIITFVLAERPFEKTFVKKGNYLPMYALNLFVAFGIVLGRVQRVNSWEVLTNIHNVIAESLRILKSLELVVLVIIFAVFCQIIYLTLEKRVLKIE